MAKKSKKKPSKRVVTAQEILDIWTAATKSGLGVGKKLHREILETMTPILLARIQTKLAAGDDFATDKEKTKTVAKDVGKICRMFTKGSTVDLDTFTLVFEFVKDNHPVCPPSGGSGGWCDD